MADDSPERKLGCFNAVFGRRRIPRRSTSTGSLPSEINTNANNLARAPSTPSFRRVSGDGPILEIATADGGYYPRSAVKPHRNHQTPAANFHQKTKQHEFHHGNKKQGKNVSEAGGTMNISEELENMIADHQRSKSSTTTLVRASSGNVMLYGNLGNLRQQQQPTTSENILDFYLPKTANETEPKQHQNNGKYTTSVMGNVVMSKKQQEQQVNNPSLCRAISTRMDPEQLKIMGNEDYKNGRFAEALALYDAAISIDPNKASYRSNKSAALAALGRILEAVFECREAIRIEPCYQRAHNRLSTLYLRLGDAEKAMHHFKQAGPEADPDVINKAKNLQIHLNRCTESKRQRDWNMLLKESELAILAVADSAPQIFGLKAEALMKLHKYEEADVTLKNCPNFDLEKCTKFFGPTGHASFLIVQAQVDMAAGRVEAAEAAAQQAHRLDPSGKEVAAVARRIRAVVAARTKGNELFKAKRYSEACLAYGEGLDSDPYNAVLLCNRAACRTKLGQYEKAMEDCNAALKIRPSFTKARLRRCDCLFKMGKWEACIEECEILMKETPEDNEEISEMMKAAQTQLRKHH